MSDLVVNFTITPLAAGVGPATALQFHHVNDGWIPSLQDIGEEVHRVGDDGTVAQTLGTVGRPVRIPCSAAFATMDLAVAFCSDVELLQWTEVSVQDAYGRMLPRVRVTSAMASAPVRCRGVTVGGQPSVARVDCVIECELLPS